MKYSQLDESLIYEAKRAFEQTISDDRYDIIKDGKLRLKSSAIDGNYPMPDLACLKKQIDENLSIHNSPKTYVEELKTMFPNLSEIMKKINELKYEKEYERDRMWLAVGSRLDIDNEKYAGFAPFFYLGERYNEIHNGDKTPFATAAICYFYYDNPNSSTFPTIEEKEVVYLLGRFNNEYYILSRYIECLTELLNLSETIKETIKQAEEPLQPLAAATTEPPELMTLDITAVAHKVVLFHELGVIDPLKEFCRDKNPTLSDAQFADLVGSMMGFKGRQLDTVRKALISYGHGKGGDVKSATAMKKVKSELMKFGIDL